MQTIQNSIKKTSQFMFKISYIWALLIIVPDIVMVSMVHQYVSNYNYLFVVPIFIAIFQGAYLFTTEIFSGCEPEYYIKMKNAAFYFNIICLMANIGFATVMSTNNYISVISNVILPAIKTFFTMSYSIERCANVDRYGFIIEEERYLQNIPENRLVINEDNRNTNLLREVIIIKETDSKTCAICLEECIAEPNNYTNQNNKKISCMQNCKHIFHEECIKEWITKNKTCPQCRK